MFAVQKNRYTCSLIGIFVFLFISVVTFDAHASVCFLPTGCGEDDVTIVGGDNPSWADCYENQSDCEENNVGAECVKTDDGYCPKYSVSEPEPDNSEPTCNTSCSDSKHIECGTDDNGCPKIVRDCGSLYVSENYCLSAGNKACDDTDGDGCWSASVGSVICPDNVTNAYDNLATCENRSAQTTCEVYSEAYPLCYKEVDCTSSNENCEKCVKGPCEDNCPVGYTLNCSETTSTKCTSHSQLTSCKVEECKTESDWLNECPAGRACDESNECYKVSGCATGYEESCPTGRVCTEINGCYQVGSCDTANGYYDTCPDGKTCEEVNGCQRVEGECPADKICVNYEFTCNDGECTEHFFNAWKERYKDVNCGDDCHLLDAFALMIDSYGLYNSEDEEYTYPSCLFKYVDGSVSDCSESYFEFINFNNLIKRIEIQYLPSELYIELGHYHLFNTFSKKVVKIDKVYVNEEVESENASVSDFNISFYEGGSDIDFNDGSKYREFSGNTVNVKMNIPLEDYIAPEPEVELDPEPAYSGTCSEGSYNVVVSAYCSHLADSDCQSFIDSEANSYVQSTVSTCEQANARGCIDAYLIDGDDNKIKPTIYQIYTDSNKIQYVYTEWDELILAEDIGNPNYTSVDYDAIEDSLTPTDTFKYFFGCVEKPENYTVKVNPIRKKFVNGDFYAAYREFAFMENEELTYEKEIPLDSILRDKNNVYVVSKDLSGNELILYPVMDVEERVFYGKLNEDYFINQIYLMLIVNDFLGLDKSKLYNFSYPSEVGYEVDMGIGGCGNNCDPVPPEEMCASLGCYKNNTNVFYGTNKLSLSTPLSAYEVDKKTYYEMENDKFYMSRGVYDSGFMYKFYNSSNILSTSKLKSDDYNYLTSGKTIFGDYYPYASKVYMGSGYGGSRCPIKTIGGGCVEGNICRDRGLGAFGMWDRSAECSASNAAIINSGDRNTRTFKTGGIIYRGLGY